MSRADEVEAVVTARIMLTMVRGRVMYLIPLLCCWFGGI